MDELINGLESVVLSAGGFLLSLLLIGAIWFGMRLILRTGSYALNWILVTAVSIGPVYMLSTTEYWADPSVRRLAGIGWASLLIVSTMGTYSFRQNHVGFRTNRVKSEGACDD